MKIKKICIIALIIVLISSLATSCFAVTEATEATNNSKITKEQLNEKFQELKDNDSEIEKIVTGDNVIEVIKNNDKYEIEYEIEEDKVTFSIEAEVKQGMSWEEYTKLFGDSTGDASDGNIEDGLAMGYYAVANILGAEYKSAAWYYTLTRIEGYKGKYAKSDKWIIMKDAEGVTEIKTDSSEEKVLNTKDFANRTMEYFNSIYKDDTYTYEDSNHCNTYKSITEKKEKTDTSCKLIEKIIINTNADFSKLKVDMDSVLDNGVTEENADYVYTLKVGQKIKFETSQKYSGYSCVGTGIELSEDKNELMYIINSIQTHINDKTKMAEILEERMKLLRKSQYDMLQTQINPHFLYNTLETINWMAYNMSNSENPVSKSLINLASFFRNTLTSGYFVSIENEIKYTNEYVNILALRYGDLFDIEWDIDESILSYTIIKICLQPIIENAVYHGIKQKNDKGLIKIKGLCDDNNIILIVSDDGVGIEKDALDELNKTLSETSFTNEKSHIGLSNVNQRIKIIFGDSYGIHVESTVGVGTDVYVTIPKKEQ